VGRFVPDYNHILQAAKNIDPDRYPLYDHNIDPPFLTKYFNVDMDSLLASGKSEDLREYFRLMCGFFEEMGYDCVSFEVCIGPYMPGSGSLGGHKTGEIQNRKDFENYPWDKIEDLYFSNATKYYEILRESLVEGMKAVGGPGNGIFECVQDIVGYESLCLISFDDAELYKDLFRTVGQINSGIWKRFLDNYSDIYAVCRFGDDLGYKTSTMLNPDDIRRFIIPEYSKIIDIVHSYGKPFLLHSCGNIFNVMEDIIEVAGIDAKHSNEDMIAPFTTWIEKYGDRISNFGGVDMDVLCQWQEDDIRRYTLDVLEKSIGHGGVAFGSGNSIPGYVPVKGYLAMNKAIREFRGEQ